MKFEIDIPDEIIEQVDVAIEKHDARAERENMPKKGIKANQFVVQELQRCVLNFILDEHRQDLMMEAEGLTMEEGKRLSDLLLSSLPKDK